LGNLRTALRDVIACFPVYRSYIRPGQAAPDDADRRHIERAVAEAKRRNPSTAQEAFDFLADVLLLRDPDGLTDAQRGARRHFVMKFQQVTGPVMAKGFE